MQEEKFRDGGGGGSALIPVALSRQGGRLIWKKRIPAARWVGRVPACQLHSQGKKNTVASTQKKNITKKCYQSYLVCVGSTDAKAGPRV